MEDERGLAQVGDRQSRQGEREPAHADRCRAEVATIGPPASTGTLVFTPINNATGVVTITVTANDGQPSNNIVARTFSVTVNSVNDLPTLDPRNPGKVLHPLPVRVAERLEFADVAMIDWVGVGRWRVGYEVLESPMPALIVATQALGEPRYPSLKGIMAARSKTLETKTLADITLGDEPVGGAAATSTVVGSEARTRLPSSIMRMPVRPAIGAVTSV